MPYHQAGGAIIMVPSISRVMLNGHAATAIMQTKRIASLMCSRLALTPNTCRLNARNVVSSGSLICATAEVVLVFAVECC